LLCQKFSWCNSNRLIFLYTGDIKKFGQNYYNFFKNIFKYLIYFATRLLIFGFIFNLRKYFVVFYEQLQNYINTLIFPNLFILLRMKDYRFIFFCNLFTIIHFEWRTHPYSSILFLNLNDGAASKSVSSSNTILIIWLKKQMLILIAIKIRCSACTVYKPTWGSILWKGLLGEYFLQIHLFFTSKL